MSSTGRNPYIEIKTPKDFKASKLDPHGYHTTDLNHLPTLVEAVSFLLRREAVREEANDAWQGTSGPEMASVLADAMAQVDQVSSDVGHYRYQTDQKVKMLEQQLLRVEGELRAKESYITLMESLAAALPSTEMLSSASKQLPQP